MSESIRMAGARITGPRPGHGHDADGLAAAAGTGELECPTSDLIANLLRLAAREGYPRSVILRCAVRDFKEAMARRI